MSLKDAIKDILPRTTDPGSASKDSSGATEAKGPERRERRQGDYLPVIACLAAGALVLIAFLRPPSLPNLAPPVPRERAEEHEESSFGYE